MEIDARRRLIGKIDLYGNTSDGAPGEAAKTRAIPDKKSSFRAQFENIENKGGKDKGRTGQGPARLGSEGHGPARRQD